MIILQKNDGTHSVFYEFIQFIKYNKIKFCGMDFFDINRRTYLQTLNFIATYFIVVFQFYYSQ